MKAGALERHPDNPGVTRTIDRAWMEDELPVLDWENPVHRLVLPTDLHASLTAATPPVLRWADQKFRVVLEKHSNDRAVILSLSDQMKHWRYHGQESGAYEGNQRILIQTGGRWYAVSIGADEHGNHNVVTVFGGSRASFLTNRLRGLKGIVEREK